MKYLFILLAVVPLTAQQLTELALAERWKEIPGASSDTEISPAVRRLLTAHAELIAGSHTRAVCEFATETAIDERATWLAWTGRLTASHPGSAVAWFLHGDALARSGQLTPAMEALDTSVRLKPNLAPAHNARGVLFALQGNVNRAFMEFRSAARSAQPLLDAQVNTGFLYVQQKGPARGARNAFESALSAQPSLALAQAGLAFVLAAQGDFTASRTPLSAALAFGECMPDLLAVNLLRMSDWVNHREAVQLAGLSSDAVGTTLNHELIKGLNGDPKAIRNAAKIAAEHPEYQKKFVDSVNKINANDPKTQAAVAKGVEMFKREAQQQKSMNDFLSTVKVNAEAKGEASAQVGGGAARLSVGGRKGIEVGVESGNKATMKVSGSVGATADLGKLVATAQSQDAARTSFAAKLQSDVKAVTEKAGGVTANLESARVDRGDWPFLPHYALAYPPLVSGGAK